MLKKKFRVKNKSRDNERESTGKLENQARKANI